MTAGTVFDKTRLHRLRRAMIRPGREPLSGLVEVDKSFVGRSLSATGPAVKRRKLYANQSDLRHTIVAIAVEIKTPKGFGRIRLRRVPDTSAASVLPFVKDVVKPGSIIRTDGWWAYQKLEKLGYRRERTVIKGADEPEPVTYAQIVGKAKHNI